MATKEKVYATGFKAYNKGLICDPTGHNPTQYEEGKVYEVEKAQPCECGFHFCKAPLSVLNYYPLIDNDGNMTEFTTVEALDDVKTDDNEKFCTKKIRIGAKLDFPALVKASVDFAFETSGSKTKKSDKDNEKIKSSGYSAQIGSSGNSAQIGSSGYYAQIGSSGNFAQIGSSGNSAQIGSSGNFAQIGSSGNSAQIGSSGNSAKIGSSGNSAKIGSSGNSAQIGSSGNSAKIGSSGNFAKIVSEGKHSVVCCAGHNSIAKAKKGSWITLSEWVYNDDEKACIPICVKTAQVDGETIKEDTFYRLVNGEFVEQ